MGKEVGSVLTGGRQPFAGCGFVAIFPFGGTSGSLKGFAGCSHLGWSPSQAGGDVSCEDLVGFYGLGSGRVDWLY